MSFSSAPSSSQEPQYVRDPEALVLSHRVLTKIKFLCHHASTEVAGFGISLNPRRPLDIHDFLLVPQAATAATFDFLDSGLAAFQHQMWERFQIPFCQCRQVCFHTHPGSSARPSHRDETHFTDHFADVPWAVMAILARGGEWYARLRINTPKAGNQHRIRMDKELKVEVDSRTMQSPIEQRLYRFDEWIKELERNVNKNVSRSSSKNHSNRGPGHRARSTASANSAHRSALERPEEDVKVEGKTGLASGFALDRSSPLHMAEDGTLHIQKGLRFRFVKGGRIWAPTGEPGKKRLTSKVLRARLVPEMQYRFALWQRDRILDNPNTDVSFRAYAAAVADEDEKSKEPEKPRLPLISGSPETIEYGKEVVSVPKFPDLLDRNRELDKLVTIAAVARCVCLGEPVLGLDTDILSHRYNLAEPVVSSLLTDELDDQLASVMQLEMKRRDAAEDKEDDVTIEIVDDDGKTIPIAVKDEK